jgi:hypothetical protein
VAVANLVRFVMVLCLYFLGAFACWAAVSLAIAGLRWVIEDGPWWLAIPAGCVLAAVWIAFAQESMRR